MVVDIQASGDHGVEVNPNTHVPRYCIPRPASSLYIPLDCTEYINVFPTCTLGRT